MPMKKGREVSRGRHPQRACQQCGELFWPKRSDTRMCSTKCQRDYAKAKRRSETAAQLDPRQCIICGTTFKPVRKNHVCCTVECNDKKGKLKLQAAVAANLAAIVRTCAHKPCSQEFTPQNRKDQIYCSSRCADRAGRKFWKDRNPEKVRSDNRKHNRERYRKDPEFRERLKQTKRNEWAALSKEERQEIGRKYRENLDPIKKRIYFRNYHRERLATDVEFRLAANLRGRVRSAIQSGKGIKAKRTEELLGCTIAEARAHIESLWLPGMTWDNWAMDGWHIDHIRPCASFDLTDLEQQKQCFHYTNLQPLWAFDNLSKNDSWDSAS